MDNENTTRLDRWLRRSYPTLPQGLIEKLLRAKKILLNGKKAPSNIRVKEEDKIDIFYDLTPYKTQPKILTVDPCPKDLDLLKSIIIFENDDICVINKPYNLASQGGTGTTKHLDQLLAYHNKDWRLTHRLDLHTSGVMVIAKNLQSARVLGNCFAKHQVHKTYLAVTEGIVSPAKGKISVPIGKDWQSGKEKMLVNVEQAKDAITYYHRIKILDNNLSLVALFPKTGRTHQLRVHMAHIGYPILGDIKYGAKNKKPLHLHAYKITLPAIFSQKPLTFIAPLSDHILSTLGG